jgi:hypothetical protein
VLGRREIEKREIKIRKLMHVFGPTLVQIHALISIFLFISSQFLFYQARPMAVLEASKEGNGPRSIKITPKFMPYIKFF